MEAKVINSIDHEIWENWQVQVDADDVWRLNQRLERDGFITVREVMSDDLRETVRNEVLRLLDEFAERRDLRLATTGNTARRMSVVQSETIGANSPLIREVYESPSLRRILHGLAGTPMLACPSKDEEFLITRQEQPGDTHGWHWGDYSYALIWIIEMPPVDFGGMLQCVPHTRWDKQNPRINEYLCSNPIQTYSFRTGDIYFLRTDTTLHRTVPLNRAGTRIILNMTYTSAHDANKKLVGDDRWWENANASAATQEPRA